MTAPSGRLVICRTSDVLEGEFATRVVVDDVAYAVYRLGDRYYVSQDACSHGPGSLGEGTIIGEEIECPFHQGRFHIPTGKCMAAPAESDLKTYPVKVESDEVFVDL